MAQIYRRAFTPHVTVARYGRESRVDAEQFERAGLDRKAYFDLVRGAYDEALAGDAPENALTLSRTKQITIQGWKRPEKKK